MKLRSLEEENFNSLKTKFWSYELQKQQSSQVGHLAKQ